MAGDAVSDVATALAGWLLAGGAVLVAGVRQRRSERDQAATVVAHAELVSFRELMERARVEQDADPATALFIQTYRRVRLAGRWPQLAQLARRGELTSRSQAG